MTNKTTKNALISSVVALFLCFVMLIGTTFAWFTDEVTSKGNVIQAGELNIQLFQHTAEGSTEITDSSAPIFGKADSTTANANTADTLWEPGKTQTVYLSIKNGGNLALKYKVAIEVVDSEKNLHEVMEYIITPDATVDAPVAKDSLNWNVGTPVDEGVNVATEDVSLAVGAEHFFALSVHMDEYAGNEYMNGNVVFNIKLLAAQDTVESDSFDNLYDALASYGTPVASVVGGDAKQVTATIGMGGAVETMNLVTSYRFETTETYEEAQKSPYRYYHADFVVSADKEIPAGSVALAGYYEAYCEDYNDGHWVALRDDQNAIAANTELRLLYLMLNGGSMNYQELCNWVPVFDCGIAVCTTDETVLKQLEGTTITVELRLYETTIDPSANSGSANIETGEYITVGVYHYTFPTTTTNP